MTLSAVGVPFDRNIGASGAVLAVTSFIFTQMQASGPRTRKVAILTKVKSPFSAAVSEGLSKELQKLSYINFEAFEPSGDQNSILSWQVETLQNLEDYDAVVVLPAGDDSTLWETLAKMSKRGVFIAVADTKPPNRYFREVGAPRPAFICSDFTKGGRIVGDKIVELLKEGENGYGGALVACGPGDSWPGMERSRAIIYTIASRGFGGFITCVEIGSWKSDLAASTILEALDKLHESLDAEKPNIIVYCANDKIMRYLAKRMPSKLYSSTVGLIGYDGIQSYGGEYLAHWPPLSLGTVDVQAYEQGVNLGNILTEEYLHGNGVRGSLTLDPKWVDLS